MSKVKTDSSTYSNGALRYQYKNVEVVEVDGVKRVRNIRTGELVPMTTAVRKSKYLVTR